MYTGQKDKKKKKKRPRPVKMGAIVTTFPDVDAEVQITWSDANLRLRQAIWAISSNAAMRVTVFREDTQAYVMDQVFTGPDSGTINIAGTFTMEWYQDPDYPEEPPHLRFPEGLRTSFCKV